MTISDYLKTDGRRFIQYNMWKNCNNGCDFCFNRGYKKSTVEEQLGILEFTKNRLLDEESREYNEIGFIGGEFFDNQIDDERVCNGFYELFDICKNKRERGELDKICVATSLIFDTERHLKPFIRYLKDIGILDMTLFCTSYDTKYRFHTEEQLRTWEYNMKDIRKMLDNRIHTEIIVSQFFIDDVESGKFSIPRFQEEFDTSIDYIEPTFIDYFNSREDSIRELPDFFPRRKSFIDFVRKHCLELGEIDISRFLSIKLRSDTSYYQLASGEWIKIDDRWRKGIRRIDKNGDTKTIFSYSDSDRCMTEDVLILANGAET